MAETGPGIPNRLRAPPFDLFNARKGVADGLGVQLPGRSVAVGIQKSAAHGVVIFARAVQADLDPRQFSNRVDLVRDEDPIGVHGDGDAFLRQPFDDLIDVPMQERFAAVQVGDPHAELIKIAERLKNIVFSKLLLHGSMPVAIGTGKIATPGELIGQREGGRLNAYPRNQSLTKYRTMTNHDLTYLIR